MGLEDFKVPKTPESRTPFVVLLLLMLGLIVTVARWVWQQMTGVG